MRNSFDLPQAASQIPGVAITCEHLDEPARKIGLFAVVRAEFGRALAAERRYESLRCGRAPSDIPRTIFEELYAGRMDSENESVDQSNGVLQGHASPLLFTFRRSIGWITGRVFGRGV